MIESFIQQMEQNGFSFNIFGPKKSCVTPISGGLAIFSKIQIEEFGQQKFSIKGCNFDKFTAKGYQYILVNDILIVNTHLQADYAKDAKNANSQVQLSQLKEIHDFTKNYQKVILLGDLNIDYFSSQFVKKGMAVLEQKRVQHGFNIITGEYDQFYHNDQPSLGFNQPSKQYSQMMNLFNEFSDLMLKQYDNMPPITFRDCDIKYGKIIQQDDYLSPADDCVTCMRLDYALTKNITCQGKVFTMKLNIGEHIFLTKLSDHNAMEIIVNIIQQENQINSFNESSAIVQNQVDSLIEDTNFKLELTDVSDQLQRDVYNCEQKYVKEKVYAVKNKTDNSED
ncbi:Neutral sphingomyelinase [Spironucleus salmonicida]|nr:Neutral sphingomyelinase [Spironucleus salmonicida]